MKLLFSFAIVILFIGCHPREESKPWQGHAQSIPGRVECEWYDLGGEGVAYHDSDLVNNGSGKLNPVNGDPLNEFRMNESIDISYTKGKGIDNNPFNRVPRDTGRLYVGWTVPGEWLHYTVDVAESGDYSVALLYTANGDGAIAIDVDDEAGKGSIRIPSTHDDRDSIPWRQWHHWNRLDHMATIHLEKGRHVLTLRTMEHGNMNYDYLEFRRE